MKLARIFLFVGIVGMGGVGLPQAARAADYNSVESLCAAYEGQPILTARGRTKLVSCDGVRILVAGVKQEISGTPFGSLARRIQQNPDKPWSAILEAEPTLRQSCSRDLSITPAYTCKISGLNARVFLSKSGAIGRWEIAVPSSSPLFQNQLELQKNEDGIDSYTAQGVRLMMDALAMRWRQLASDGETYHVNGDLMTATITNVHAN